jgi:DNA-binding MarR family transcriptional regulator
MSTTTTTPFGTQVIGQTEKALGAILDRLLAGTGLNERQWVTLTVTVASGGTVARDQLVGRLAGILKVSEAAAQARITELAGAGLLQVPDGEGSVVRATDAGQQLHGRIRSAITEITERLWGDLPAEDLATAGRVLSTVLARANAELAGA